MLPPKCPNKHEAHPSTPANLMSRVQTMNTYRDIHKKRFAQCLNNDKCRYRVQCILEVPRIPKGFKRRLHKTKRYKDRRVPKGLTNLKVRSGPGRTDRQRVQDEWRMAQHKLFWRMVVDAGPVRCSLRDKLFIVSVTQ